MVDLYVPKEGPVLVRLTVPAHLLPAQPQEVTLSFIRLGDEAWNRVIGLPRRVDVSSSADLRLEYAVDVRPLGDSGKDNRLAIAFDVPSGRVLPLWSLVPKLSGAIRSEQLTVSSVHVASELPVTSSMEGSAGAWWGLHPNDLYSGVVVAGHTYEAVGSNGLRFISPDFDEPTMERYAAVEKQASALLEKWTGPRQKLESVVIVQRPPGLASNGVMGVNVGLNALVIANTFFDGTALSQDGFTMLHELTHSSLPTDGRVPHWIGEGFTDYFAQRIGIELDGFGPETHRELLTETWKAFVESAPSRRAGDTEVGDYLGGRVLAHCVDVRLRRDGTSLEDVLRKARARAEGELTNDLWEAEMAVASPAAGARIVSARIDPLDPPEACFAEEGLRRRQTAAGFMLEVVVALTGIRAVVLDPRNVGVLVSDADPKGHFQKGDRLTWLEGTRLVNLAHLQEALLAVAFKQVVRIEYLRKGVSRFVDLTIPPRVLGFTTPIDRPIWVPAVAKEPARSFGR